MIAHNFSVLPCSPSGQVLIISEIASRQQSEEINTICNSRNVMANNYNYIAFDISPKETIQLIQKKNKQMNKCF